MEDPLFPPVGAEIARKRRELAPNPLNAFKAFSAAVFADGALPNVTKQLIAVAVAHVTQCPYCIKGHTAEALKQGVIDAYADALAPSFWYLVPLLVLGFVLSLFLREVRLSHEAGMVARGEAVAG